MLKQKKDCEKCEFGKTVYAQDQFHFIGCYCKPYRGKWVREIKDCPKEKLETSNSWQEHIMSRFERVE